ncbi:MAG: S8 family serine peptidase, partial [candidate division WOR-3 bacterium]
GKVFQVTTSPFGTVIHATVPGELIFKIARQPEAFWIQELTNPALANMNCQWVTQSGWRSVAPPDTSLQARPIWQKGVRGQRVIMSTTDTGLNLGHDMFRDPALSVTPPGIWPEHRKVVAYKNYAGADAYEAFYHGSHVNGTVAGDDSVTNGTSFYDGMAIKSRLYFVDITNGNTFLLPTDLWSLWDTVYFGRGLPDSLRPIKQHSGSWGWYNFNGTYLIQDASTDAFSWKYKDFLNIIAAGNEYSARTIRNPGIAKNVLTVGATQNGTSANTIADFSSRGPTQDGRLKPTVMAPGQALYSATASGTNTYESMDGTSMATPAVNGTVGLLRCYLQEGYYPTGAPVVKNRLTYISSALLRSMAVNSCDPNIGSYTPPNNNIGWGRIDADSVLYFSGDTRRLILKDDTFGVATGEYKQEQFQVNSSIPLRVTLAWTDTAAAPNASPTLVNNLDLELISPSGVSYHGNKYSGGQSVPNPNGWDSLNTEECCRINSPETGLWTIKVWGRNVVTSKPQPFAWTITGSVGHRDVGPIGILAPAGIVDSGSVVTPKTLIKNFSDKTETLKVVLKIGTAYVDTQPIVLSGGVAETLAFSSWSANVVGTYVSRCTTLLNGDNNPANDILIDTFEVGYGSGVTEEITIPKTTFLAPAMPNPFRRIAIVKFGLPEPSFVQIQIFSVTGELLKTLFAGEKSAGFHSISWNGTDQNNRPVGYGVFYCQMKSKGKTLVRKMVKTK